MLILYFSPLIIAVWEESGRQESHFIPEASTGIRMQLSKGKNIFIKGNITRDVDSSGGRIKALETFVYGAIAQKNALFLSKLKFVSIIGTKVWPICNPKARRDV